MNEDTKMEDLSKKTALLQPSAEASQEDDENNITPPTPALEVAVRRLGRLLGGGLSEKDRQFHTYSNSAKVVRRWLELALSAAQAACSGDITAAAMALVDLSDASVCQAGRDWLLAV